MKKRLLLAICLCVLPTSVFAQGNPYRVLGGDAESADAGPYVFLGCCSGAWSLNAANGFVLHHRGGQVEHWALVQDSAVPDWYYYHEQSLDGTVDFPEYKWRFYRYYDPANPKVGIYRKYPTDVSWTYVCTACLSLLPKDAVATLESRKAAAKQSLER